MFYLIIKIVTFSTFILWCIENFSLIFLTIKSIITIAQHPNKKNLFIINKKKENKLNRSLLDIFYSIFPVLLVVFIIRSCIFEPFKINSCSMMPTLLVGDFIIVEKLSYGIKNPITKKNIIYSFSPKRGDIVVFKYPENSRITYIKRVVGLPGDVIIYDTITKQLKVKPIGALYYFPIIYSDFVHTYNGDSGIIFNKSNESLGGAVHEIITVPSQQDRVEIYYKKYLFNNFAEWVVPKGEYFMIGDNRDNSYDSRYWGFVQEKNIIGKAKVIWMSFYKKNGILRTSIRFSRIGCIIY